MEDKSQKQTTHRRGFLGSIAASAAALGIATLGTPAQLAAENFSPFGNTNDADEWFNQIKGKHRIVYDVVEPTNPILMPFAWSRVFLATNGATGTPEKDVNVVVVLRHNAIPFAMNHDLWAKYKFGEMFKINDPATNAASVRNPFWQPKPGEYKMPGFGPLPIGINELQASGVMFCVCNAALTVYSAVVADGMKANSADILKEWTAGVLQGIQVVPSGVWAVGRAQEHSCAYCYAG